LIEVLQRPLEGANSSVIIVDGIDEVHGGQQAGQQLLERLTKAVGRGKRTKLVALAQSLSLPNGARGQTYKISPEDTRDDIHAVAIRALAHVPFFVKKPGHEQETIIASILDAAKGSFLWTIMFSESLRSEKSPESFDKTLQTLKSSPPPVTNLVSKLLDTLQASRESILLLSWLTVSARPLTVDEIACLLTVKPETAEITAAPANVTSIVDSILPLLSVKRDVIRPRHSVITSVLQTVLQPLVEQGKIPLVLKNRQVDFLLRNLTYAKNVLPKDGMPTLDNSDSGLPSRLFAKHPLLEYTVRYWTSHFQQSPFAPTGNAAPKLPEELKKAFPSSTTFPVLEWICWDDQFPGSQEVDLHAMVGRVRTEIFTQNHPTVMQSYINTAAYYVPMGNDREATKSYYYATTVGQNILGHSNPVTIECGNRFLTLSSQMTSTTRTEIMTQRETILQILITAYEKQFGATSELVINTRQQLINLYTELKEHENISKYTEKQQHVHRDNFPHDGGVGGGLKDSLGGKLRKKSDKELGPGRNLFDPKADQEESDEILDLAGALALYKKAKSLHAEKDYEAAEELYVELWNQLSTICRSTLNTDFHELKLETVNSYAETLKTQKRESEAAGVLVLVSEEYRHHELSFSEKVINKLVQSAHTLSSFGHKSAALSIYRQAHSYQKHFKKDSSSTASRFEEWIEQTTSELLQSNNNSTESSTSTRSQQLLLKEQLLSQSKTIDASTISRVQQETSKYIEHRQYEEAIEMISLTLQRTWSSFLSESVSSITLSSTLLQENLVLIEQLAQVYLAQRKIEKAIDVYHRLFRAALTAPKDRKDLLEKTKIQLINIYDKYGYPAKSIGVLQEVVAVYTRVYGPTHDVTIATLYELGSRCRQNARTHPYWIEYYQQIVTALSKESKEVTNTSFEAANVVANTYWQERRSVDAVSVFALLWATFVNKTKSQKEFSDAVFVQNLYDRYRQSLEATQVDQQAIYKVTEEFAATSKAQFGAESTVAQQAISTLTQVSEHLARSDSKYESRQLQLIQEQLQHASKNSAESRSLRSQKTNIFRRRFVEQKDVSSETLNEARSLFTEELNESHSSYGYAHESTLNSLREVTMLEFRQKKTEEAMKSINAAVSEISSSETVSQEQAMQSAQSIAQIFQASQQTERAQELIQDLRMQVIAKEKRAGSRSTFDITQKNGSAALIFLASLEFHMRSDLSITWSEIFAELQAERMYYANFKKVTSGRSGLDKIVVAAAPLRFFLLKRNRKEQAHSLEQQIVTLFVQRDLSGFTLEDKNTSPTVFITGILDYLGKRKSPDFVRAVIIATNRNLSKLIGSNKFAAAYDVANVGFKYAQVHKGYEKPGAISMGFELASQLDGRGENKCPEEGLRQKLLQLSNRIVKEILAICEDRDINLAQVHLTELNELIALLGEQGDWETLESLLTSLWNTREAQRTWPAEALLNLGQRLVCARYLAGHPVKAIRLCEDISYNLRRAHGISHPATLEAFQILSQLYTSAGLSFQKKASSDKSAGAIAADYLKKAVIIEEDILRWFVSEGAGTNDDEDDTAAAILAEHGVQLSSPADEDAEKSSVDRSAEVNTHMRLLKLAFQRYGQWPKSYGVYEQLNADVFANYGSALKGAEGVEKWSAKGFGAGKAESDEGAFTAPKQWDILVV